MNNTDPTEHLLALIAEWEDASGAYITFRLTESRFALQDQALESLCRHLAEGMMARNQELEVDLSSAIQGEDE